MSSTHTTQQPGRGPLRATLRPRGLAEHNPSTISSVSVGGTTSGPAHHYNHRRTQSTEAIPLAREETCSSCSHCSCCSHGQPLAQTTAGLHRRHSSSCGALDTQRHHGDKENSVVSVTTSKLPHGGRAWSDSGGSQGDRTRPLQPFKDRTNIQESVGSNPKPGLSATTTGDKCGSLKELVAPLNAARLRPIQQQTRSATVGHCFSLTY